MAFKQVKPKPRYVASGTRKGPGGFAQKEKAHWALPNGSWVKAPPQGAFHQLHPVAQAVHRLLTGGFQQIHPAPSQGGFTQQRPAPSQGGFTQVGGSQGGGGQVDPRWALAAALAKAGPPDEPQVAAPVGSPFTGGVPEWVQPNAQQDFLNWANAQRRRAAGPEAY